MSGWKLCPPADTFDVTRSASLYSSLAGVLAGFAFFAMIYILTAMQGRLIQGPFGDDEASSEQNHVIISLVSAFLGLVVATFLYAVLSAEQNESLIGGRASGEELLSGIAFAFAVMALLYGLTLLIGGVGLTITAHEARAIIVMLGPPLSMMFLGFAAQDDAFAEFLSSTTISGGHKMCYEPSFYRQTTIWATTVLPLFVFGTCLALVVLSRTVLNVGRGFALPRGRRWFSRNALPKLSLLVCLAAAIWSATWSERDPGAHLSHAQVWCWLVATAVGLTVQAVFILWSRAGETLLRPRREPAGGGRHSIEATGSSQDT